MAACLHTSSPAFDTRLSAPAAVFDTKSSSWSPRSAYDLLSGTFAVILLVAAALKTHALHSTFNLESPWKQLAQTIAILVEWLLAIWLLWGVAKRWARRTAVTVLTIFLIVAGTRWLRGDEDCGCFGRFSVHPLWTMLFDAAVLFAIFWLGRERSSVTDRLSRRRIVSTIAASILIPGLTIFGLTNRGTTEIVIVDLETSRGERFPLLDFMEPAIRSNLSEGTCTLILFDRNCQRCREYLDTLVLAAGSGPVYLIDIAAGGADAHQSLMPHLPHVSLRNGPSYVVTVPSIVFLKNGVLLSSHSPPSSDRGGNK